LGSSILLTHHSVLAFTEEDELAEDQSVKSVTCGSVIKLKHVGTGYRLHSHEVSYGSGSKQQTVTGFPNKDDNNSFWIVRQSFQSPACRQGSEIKKRDIIRLQHLNTLRNLHSHTHVSPMTQQQEVSCFGDNGNGDVGDNWRIVPTTSSSTSEFWLRGEKVRLQHVDTALYLSTTSGAKYGNPIAGQLEVSARPARGSIDQDIEWQTEEGFYFAIEK